MSFAVLRPGYNLKACKDREEILHHNIVIYVLALLTEMLCALIVCINCRCCHGYPLASE